MDVMSVCALVTLGLVDGDDDALWKSKKDLGAQFKVDA
jgi:hypothetical protein